MVLQLHKYTPKFFCKEKDVSPMFLNPDMYYPWQRKTLKKEKLSKKKT